jgi:opacity protein-like surface antigen
MKTLITTLFLLICNTSFSQWSFNVHGGYAYTSIPDQILFSESKNSFVLGLGSAYNITKSIAFIAEVNYELKGSKGTLIYTSANSLDNIQQVNQQLQLHYITLPVMARYFIGKKGIKVFVNAGMYYGFLTEARISPKYSDLDLVVTPGFKRNDIGLAGGLGMLVNVSKKIGISLEWRNHYGLTNTVSNLSNQYNRSNIVQLGVQYGFSKKE